MSGKRRNSQYISLRSAVASRACELVMLEVSSDSNHILLSNFAGLIESGINASLVGFGG